MAIKQISVFVENQVGKLYALTKALGESGIDFVALSIADTTDFGILRCIVSDTARAIEIIKANGFTVSTTSVIAVEVPDQPGGLSSVLKVLADDGINVEYLYSFVRTVSESALILFKVEDYAAAVDALAAAGLRMITDEEIKRLDAKEG